MRRIAALVLAASTLALARPVDAPAAPPAGLPSGVPPAALRPEPALPAPAGWPFGEAFPRTSGTGRLAGGALFWTDFLYDDHGPDGTATRNPSPAGLAPSAGVYSYPDGPAAGNGADVFRAAVGLDATATWWRVDWTTLVEPAVPVAVWALDRDRRADTGEWAFGDSGVSGAGAERTLVVSSRGAWLDGSRIADVAVDRAARSFVVRIPRSVLPVAGTSHVRLLTGLANPEGTGFAEVPSERGWSAAGGRAYDAAFNTGESGYWMDEVQAAALASGDASDLVAAVDWSALRARTIDPEPRPTGWSNRWFVSSIEPGHGVVGDSDGSSDLRPNFLGRVQPYGVYVPSSYDPAKPAPLTWVLHSLSEQHNQYAVLTPGFLEKVCEDRGSICVTTLGRGPDGWYHDEAELDFWEVWNRVASSYAVDPDRTVLSGYSMGGYGTYKLGLEHPDLFAKAVVVAGPPICGIRLAEPFDLPSQGSRACTDEGDTGPLVQNARDLPFSITHGAADQLVPVSSVEEQVGRFAELGFRHRYDLLFTEDHLAWGSSERLTSVAEQYGEPTRAPNPARVTYRFWTGHQVPALGIGPSGAWWVQDLRPGRSLPGDQAGVDVTSQALRSHEDAWDAVTSTAPLLTADGQPGATRSTGWEPSTRTSFVRRPKIRLVADNVGGLRIDLRGAGFRDGEPGSIDVESRRPLELVLSGVRPGMVVRVDGREVGVVGRDGRAVARTAAGGGQVTVTTR